ncbi:MAG: hypothetical protein ACJ703_00610 [Nitrososphaera sp.]
MRKSLLHLVLRHNRERAESASADQVEQKQQKESSLIIRQQLAHGPVMVVI